MKKQKKIEPIRICVALPSELTARVQNYLEKNPAANLSGLVRFGLETVLNDYEGGK